MIYRFFLIFCLVVVYACNGTERLAQSAPTPVLEFSETGPTSFQDWMHSPLRPLDFEPISFSVNASSDEGIKQVMLYIFEYELYESKEGLKNQRARPNGIWGKVRTWNFDDPLKTLELSHTHGLGFGKHSRIEYIWRVVDVDGETTDRFARFDAGTSPWPEDKVLLYSASRRPMGDVIDIGFFRDTDYEDNMTIYNSDLEKMLNNGFFAEKIFSDNRQYWAFYTTDRSLDGKAISNDITNDDNIPTWLKDFSIPGIDAFCLLHREDYTDRSLLLENFHSLSNNLFSAEAHNWGTAVHECGHAIFHLSDEYGGCACFQTHNSSNVFREQSDCAAWNVANGFPAEDCFELNDLYERTWYTAEEPTFFQSEAACIEHNRKLGLSADSCRNFIDVKGEELFWAFESTCIMLDDGDNLVRPFQRACSQVITDYFSRLRSQDNDIAFAKTHYENIFGYEDVVIMEMTRNDNLWSLNIGEARLGVPTNSLNSGGEVVMRVMNENGGTVADYRLSQPGAVHVHAGDKDQFEVPSTGTVRVAVPALATIERVVCEFDLTTHQRSANNALITYAEPFVFNVAADVKAAILEKEQRSKAQ